VERIPQESSFDIITNCRLKCFIDVVFSRFPHRLLKRSSWFTYSHTHTFNNPRHSCRCRLNHSTKSLAFVLVFMLRDPPVTLFQIFQEHLPFFLGRHLFVVYRHHINNSSLLSNTFFGTPRTNSYSAVKILL